ncbi:MAG TPA: hypothetical protein VMS76_16860 [Planctomycetota bacterium]|nr:hypothetical protein [Planctomycetota bacterium]
MKTTSKITLATILALATGGATGTPAEAAASPAIAAVASTGDVIQWHGSVLKPVHPCGYRLIVLGPPGTHFDVYTITRRGSPTLMASGNIPAGGLIGTAVSAPGCELERPTVPVQVVSIASAPIRVDLMYW